MIAALFVETNGVYFGLPEVDPWDQDRDARLYPGPWPVVAHPPCARWSKLAWVVQAKHGRLVGDDGGCFAAALAAVRTWGGVLEHPEGSAAWKAHGLITPPKGGGWVSAGFCRGWTCCVEQGHYGHKARKASWLYAWGAPPPSLIWGRSQRTAEAHHRGIADMTGPARSRTPLPFRDLLLSIASTAHPQEHAA